MEAGMVLNKDIDEIKTIKNRIKTECDKQSSYHLHINPTLDCNFRCWYCYEKHEKGSKMDQAIIDSIELHIFKVLENNNFHSFQLSFFGGEPLLYFFDTVSKVISSAHRICINKGIPMKVHFTTNGYLLNDEIIKFLSNYDVSFQITLDGSKEFHDKVRKNGILGSYDKIFENITKLSDIFNKVIVRINYTRVNIASIEQIMEDLCKSGANKTNIFVDLQQVWQDHDSALGENTSERISELMSKFRKNEINCSSPLPADSLINPCYADRNNHILINYNGEVYFCTARDFVPQNSVGFLNKDGEIHWKNPLFKDRSYLKFSNKFCYDCKIAGICGGGCVQKGMENTNSFGCPIGFNVQDVNEIILNRLERLIVDAQS